MSKNTKGRGDEAVNAAEATLNKLKVEGHINDDRYYCYCLIMILI